MRRIALVSFLLLCVGCGGTQRVHISGRLTRSDGSPLAAARVIFRSATTGKYASGRSDQDGRYVLGTMRQGDGILPGNYYVIVAEDRGSIDQPRPRTIDAKYERPTTSGLSFTVEPGQDSVFDIVLDPARTTDSLHR